MKKYLSIILFIFITYTLMADDFTLATWNIRNISNNGRSNAELGMVALIIQRYDIIAVQEVLDAKVLNRLKSILNGEGDLRLNYDYVVSEKVGRRKKERYAYFYNTEKIQYHGISHIVDDQYDVYEREPFYCEFTFNEYSFGLLTMHSIFGDGKEPRLREMDHLIQLSRTLIEQKDLKDRLFVLGDFNLKLSEYAHFIKGAFTNFAIMDTPTTIYSVSSYDQIMWTEDDDTHFKVTESEIFKFDEIFFPDKKAERSVANRVLSDHRPVSVKVSDGK